jgi:uncharacterized protein YndB with AHSA1/START domain
VIDWRLHLFSSPERVYELLATAKGRASFWAESAPERDGHVEFTFPGGLEWRGQILEADPPNVFSVRYYGSTEARFVLADDGAGGCELRLTDTADDAEGRLGLRASRAQGCSRSRSRPAQPRSGANLGSRLRG